MNVKLVVIIIILIFINKDEKESFFYKNVKLISNPDNLIVLVNKNNKLTSNFVPSNLVKLNTTYSYENKYVKDIVATSFEELHKDAYSLGYNITITSAYRDYNYQLDLFNYYVKEKGLTYALKASAKPGHSEHQTGLSIDVEGSNKDYDNFDKSKEFEWMKNNCYKYGFILRYPQGKEFITGFKYEPWHYRYVGINLATYITNNNLTLEEYVYNN